MTSLLKLSGREQGLWIGARENGTICTSALGRHTNRILWPSYPEFTITEKIPYCDGSLIIGYAILICRIVLVALAGFDR